MTGLVLLGLAALTFLSLSSAASSPLVVEPPPPTPSPPPSPPKKPAAAPAEYAFFNYATGEAIDPASFLNWAPSGGGEAPVATAPPAPVLPKSGEQWEQVWSLNRPLSGFELSAAKSAFSSQMKGQTLDSAVQRHTDAGTTVTVTSTFTDNATAPIPVGQTLKKLDIVATLASARRLA